MTYPTAAWEKPSNGSNLLGAPRGPKPKLLDLTLYLSPSFLSCAACDPIYHGHTDGTGGPIVGPLSNRELIPSRHLWMDWVVCRLGCSQSINVLPDFKKAGSLATGTTLGSIMIASRPRNWRRSHDHGLGRWPMGLCRCLHSGCTDGTVTGPTTVQCSRPSIEP